MEYLQYLLNTTILTNTGLFVLNLVISGIPSILIVLVLRSLALRCFKPCYKWNTFNTRNDNELGGLRDEF